MIKRILALMALSAASLLSACGGSVQSPDFVAQLAGIQVTPARGSADIGKTFQFAAQGLYTTPPGTTTGTSCSTGLCSVGGISGVSWTSADPSIATVDNNGLVTGVHLGTTSITAAVQGFKVPLTFTVTGFVLTDIVISPNTASVALGRTQAFTAQGVYSDNPSTPRAINETVNWGVSNSGVASVSPAQGSATTASTKTVGQTQITAYATNAQGDVITARNPATLTVTSPVLTSLVVSPNSISTPKGTSQQFTAQGVYTDSSTPRAVSEPVTWSSGNTSVATVSPTTGTSTTATGVSVGNAVISASAVNSENNTVTGSGNLTVDTASLTGLSQLSSTLLPPLTSSGSVPSGSTLQYYAFGNYSDGTTNQVVDPSLLNWTTAAAATATVDATGNVTGVAPGSTSVTATIKSSVTPQPTGTKTVSGTVAVTDKFCRANYQASNGATTTSSSSITLNLCLSLSSGSCNVQNKDNVIAPPGNNVSATYSIDPALLSYSLSLRVLGGTTEAVLAPAGGQQAGFVIGVPDGTAPSDYSFTINTYNGSDAVQETAGATLINLNRTVANAAQYGVYIPVTKPFTGAELVIAVPGVLSPGLPNALSHILSLGQSQKVQAFQACSSAVTK